MFVSAPTVTGNGDALTNAATTVTLTSRRYDGFTSTETGGNTSVGVRRRHRRFCTSVKLISGFRKPSAYWSAASEYSSGTCDVTWRYNHWFYGTNGYCRLVGQPGIGAFGVYGLYGPLDPGFWFGNSGYSRASYDSAAYARCINEALAQVADRSWEAGTALGEGRQSLTMVANRLRTLGKAIKYALRGQWGGVLQELGLLRSTNGRRARERAIRSGRVGDRFLDTLSNFWLEIKYGWLPLLSDIHGAIQALQNTIPKLRFAVRRRIQSKPAVRPAIAGYHTWDLNVTGTVFVETKLFGKVDDANLVLLNSLGLLNPLQVAWELVPFSFVVDWILPIGSFLEAATGTIGTTFDSGYTTYGLTVQEKLTFLRDYAPFGTSTIQSRSGNYPTAKLKVRCIDRDVHFSWPLWLPYVQSPFTRDSNVISALALLYQLRGR